MDVVAAVVLDVDDTLCLTEAVCFELENHVLSAIGRDPMTRRVHLSTWGMPLRDAMLVRSPGLEIETFMAAYEPVLGEYAADGRLDTIAPENLDAIDRLVGAGIDVMLLTSRTEREVAHLLAADHSCSTASEPLQN